MSRSTRNVNFRSTIIQERTVRHIYVFINTKKSNYIIANLRWLIKAMREKNIILRLFYSSKGEMHRVQVITNESPHYTLITIHIICMT